MVMENVSPYALDVTINIKQSRNDGIRLVCSNHISLVLSLPKITSPKMNTHTHWIPTEMIPLYYQ